MTLAGTAGMMATDVTTPQGAPPPRGPEVTARVQPVSDVTKPGIAIAPMRPARATPAEGERGGDQRVLMLMLLGTAVGSTGPFGRLGR